MQADNRSAAQDHNSAKNHLGLERKSRQQVQGQAIPQAQNNILFFEKKFQIQNLTLNTQEREQVQRQSLQKKKFSFNTLIPDGVQELADNSTEVLMQWPSKSNSMNNKNFLEKGSDRIAQTQELKKLRLQISDFNKSPVIDTICQKIWKLIIVHQYDEILLEVITHPSTLPISLELYEEVTPLFKKALGIYFNTDYYVAKFETTNQYGSTNIFYPRFMYDLISMFGMNLFHIDLPTLEQLVREVYASISFRQNKKIKLRSLAHVQTAFTEEEYNKVIQINREQSNPKIKAEIALPESRKVEDDAENFKLSGANELLTIGKNTLEIQQKAKMQKKKQLIEQIKAQNLQIVSFSFRPNSFIKQDPAKTLLELKRKQILPLQLTENAASDNLHSFKYNEKNLNVEESGKISPLPLRTPLISLKSIDPDVRPNRHNSLKIYEHIQSFNTVDLDENMDMEEKFKKRVFHESIMKKLEARTDQFKLAKFLKYEQMNIKSHLYNQQAKTAKIFQEFNLPKIQDPQNPETTFEQSQVIKLYSPIFERQKQSGDLGQTLSGQIQQQNQDLDTNQNSSPIHQNQLHNISQQAVAPEVKRSSSSKFKPQELDQNSLSQKAGENLKQAHWTPNSIENMKTQNRPPMQTSGDRMSVVQTEESNIGWKKNEQINGQRYLESEMSSQDNHMFKQLPSPQNYTNIQKVQIQKNVAEMINVKSASIGKKVELKNVRNESLSQRFPNIKLQETPIKDGQLHQMNERSSPQIDFLGKLEPKQIQLVSPKIPNIRDSYSSLGESIHGQLNKIRQEQALNRNKNQQSYLKPSESDRLRERGRSSLPINLGMTTLEEEYEVKPKVWIHDVTMGDFQLQSWRTVKQMMQQKRRNSRL